MSDMFVFMILVWAVFNLAMYWNKHEDCDKPNEAWIIITAIIVL